MARFDHFDVIAPIYDRVLSARQEERLVELAGLPVPGPLLDAGGGTGRIAQGMVCHASSVVVADLSHGMLAQTRGKGRLRPVCTYSEHLPFPEDTFDCIIMVDTLHHVSNQAETAGELLRVLRPGRRLVIEEPDIDRFAVKCIALVEKLLLMRSHFFRAERIATLFAASGANVRLIRNALTAWVVIEKSP
jgi:demethylmenaquinone methyltransferase/2-methoxy-6-polyprenyl-1,4-benzoquinol methylase